MISVDEASRIIAAQAVPFDPVRLPLEDALGRTLRRDAVADSDLPPFDASAMDGYALRRSDLAVPLRVVGTSEAGAAFTGTVAAGQCVRILTGAPVPSGADWVVRQEDMTREGDIVRVARADGPDYIRRRGENRRLGEPVVRAGTRLGPPELAALAAVGESQPLVSPAPRCAHLATGNELVPPGRKPSGAQIRDSNSTLVAALIAAHTAELVGQARVPDDLAAARSAAEEMKPHDILLVSGGASVGDRDIARPLLEALGYRLHFHAINLRPGRPLVFAARDRRLAFALPGNPVSHWVVFHLFVAPLLDFLQAGFARPRARLAGRLAPGSRLPKPDGRATWWPCRSEVAGGGYQLHPLPLASSGDNAGLAGANALLPVPADAGTLAAPANLEFLPCP